MSSLLEQSSTAPLSAEQQFEQDIATVLEIALQHHHASEFADAEALYRAILDAKADHVDVNYNLGVLLVQTQRAAEAATLFEIAIGAKPDQSQYWASYIDALAQSGQAPAAWLALEMAQKRGLKGPVVTALIERLSNPEAFAARERAQAAGQQAEPAAAEELVNAAETVPAKGPTPQEINQFASLHQKGRLPEALNLAQSLVQRYPGHATGWRALGLTLRQSKRSLDAIDPLRRAIDLVPEDIESIIMLAGILVENSANDEAESLCRRAIALNAEYVEAHRLLSVVLMASSKFADGIDSARRATTLAPDDANMHDALAVALLDDGQIPEAEQHFRHALELNGRHTASHSNLLFCLTHRLDLDPAALLAHHVDYATRHETPLRALWPAHANTRDPQRRLNVGFVSGDLFRHAVTSYIEPVLQHLSTDASVSLHIYYNYDREDEATARLRALVPNWRTVSGMDDAALAATIVADRIDILIDLSGHTGRNRLPMFARKPAPVQASWIGYPGTTGLAAMDYYLADRFSIPAGKIEHQYAEKIARLPAISAFMAPSHVPPVNLLPARHNGYVTFGSFNRINKLRPEVIALWADLMKQLPGSRIVMGSVPKQGGEPMLVEWFAQAGIGRERLSFVPRANLAVYLQQLHQVDLCLDTFPYGGSTTTLNGLWMGVPTLTMPGDTLQSRGSATWLSHVGLDGFIAKDHDKADFVERGRAIAADLPALDAIRQGLRARCAQSAAFQADTVSAGLSQALRTMWQRWCNALPPENFDVTASQNA